MIAENTENLITNLGNVSFHTCYLIPIVGAVLLPLSWLGTPKDFWLAGIVAAATISVAALLIVVGLVVVSTVFIRLLQCFFQKLCGFSKKIIIITATNEITFSCNGFFLDSDARNFKLEFFLYCAMHIIVQSQISSRQTYSFL